MWPLCGKRGGLLAGGREGCAIFGVDKSHGYSPPAVGNTPDAETVLIFLKVYEDGARERFEGLFINMTDVEGVSPTQVEHRATTFGLGVAGVRVEKSGITSDKIFYQFKQ